MKRSLLALVMMCGSAFSQVSLDWQISLSDEFNFGTFPQCTSEVSRDELLAQILPSGDLVLRIGSWDYSLHYDGIISTADQQHVFKTCLEGIITQSGEVSNVNNFFIGMDDVGSLPMWHYLTFKNSARLFYNRVLINSNNYERLNNLKVDYINSTGEYEESIIMQPESIVFDSHWIVSGGDHSHLNHFYTVGLYSYSVDTTRDDGSFRSFTCPTNLVVTKYSITSSSESYPENGSIISTYTSAGFNQDNFVLNWDTSSGTEYQIQSSTDLTNWVNVGSAIVGTGESMTWANHITNSQAFYRVVEE